MFQISVSKSSHSLTLHQKDDVWSAVRLSEDDDGEAAGKAVCMVKGSWDTVEELRERTK